GARVRVYRSGNRSTPRAQDSHRHGAWLASREAGREAGAKTGGPTPQPPNVRVCKPTRRISRAFSARSWLVERPFCPLGGARGATMSAWWSAAVLARRWHLRRGHDRRGGGVRGVRFRAAADCEVLSRMRDADRRTGEAGGVQAGDRPIRRGSPSMDIAAAVGPERLREIMTELLERSALVVE